MIFPLWEKFKKNSFFKKYHIVTNVRIILLTLFAFFVVGCGILERPTGYSGTASVDGYEIKTCDEDDFDDKWWAFETNNAIANTFVPAYKDYCTYISPDFIFFWNQEDQYGYMNYDFEWYCKDDTTMRIEDTITGDISEVKIYGLLPNDCYSVKIYYNGKSANGEVCPCEYNGP